ncbi:MAG: hypothetical protein ACP5G2_04610 [Candidatus Bipolaricaulaceae bacterium]
MKAYLVVLAAALLVLPAFSLGVVAVGLAVLAALTVALAALALGATGSLVDWILTAAAVGFSWRAVQAGRRFVRRLRTSLAG